MNRLRESLEADNPMVAPGVFDTFTARIVESYNFDALYLGGGYTAGTSLGVKEPLLTMSEMCQRAREITARTDLPLIVDGNAGFGTPDHAARTVQEFAKAGIAAVHIEDQVFPKGIGYHSGRIEVTSTEAMVEKVRAASEAADAVDEEILVIARSDITHASTDEVSVAGTSRATGIRDAVERVNSYTDAGADAGMVFPADEAEVAYAGDNTSAPLIVPYAETHEPRLTVSEFGAAGIDGVFYPYTPTLATLKAVRATYSALANEGKPGMAEEESSRLVREAEALLGYPDGGG